MYFSHVREGTSKIYIYIYPLKCRLYFEHVRQTAAERLTHTADVWRNVEVVWLWECDAKGKGDLMEMFKI